MKRARTIAAVLLTAFTLGCAGMTPTQQRALSGGAIGAAGGAALSAIAGGSAAVGAVVGGAAGVLTGTLIDGSEHHYRNR
jgi:osmotically inducible lipoprotein OsmB